MKAIISTTIITLLAYLSLHANERPNIVLIFVDDLGYETVVVAKIELVTDTDFAGGIH